MFMHHTDRRQFSPNPASLLAESGRLPRAWAAFTLVELMISIAMVLMIIIGVYAVFDAATKTTGAGIATEELTRGQRSLERVFTRDFRAAVPADEMPCIQIYSQQVFAYRDANDRNASPGGNPQIADLGGTGSPIMLSPALYNQRNHRIDRVMFFVRDVALPFRSQTGNQVTAGASGIQPMVTPERSREAWVWYGHLNLPDKADNPGPGLHNPPKGMGMATKNVGDYFEPGEAVPENVNNYFANDWCFGRMAILLRHSTPHDYIYHSTVQMSPLGRGSKVNKTIPGGVSWLIEDSRCDVAKDTIRDFQLRYHLTDYKTISEAFDYRFACKPWLIRGSKATGQDMGMEAALTVPFLQRGVSQFIVEFAGNFVDQDSTGKVTGTKPDDKGEIDFVLPYGHNGPRQIRWYGMPRKVDTRHPDIAGRGTSTTPPKEVLESYDVVPLREMGAAVAEGIEQFYYIDPVKKDKIKDVPPTKDYVKDLKPNALYSATWNRHVLQNPVDHGTPAMFRIIMTVTDANNRLPEGQTVEYVYTLTQ